MKKKVLTYFDQSQVKLDRVLRGLVIFKGMMIEWVAVKGWEEELVKSDGQPDIWGESR